MKMRIPLQIVVAALCWQAAASCLAADEPSVLVKTVTLKKASLTTTVTSYGVVAVDPRQTLTVSFPRPGLVSRLLISAGQLVRRGAPLLDFTADPANAQSFKQAVSALEFARGELKRTESMADRQMATQSQLAAARRSVADAEATLDAQRRLGMERTTEQSTAPFAGIVTKVNIKEGDRVQKGAPLVQLARQGALRVELGVEPEDSAGIKVGLTVHLVSVFSPTETFSGTVSEIHGVIDPQTRLVDVIVAIHRNRGEKLIPGTRVRGEIVVGASTGWIIPRSAVLRDAQGGYLYQVDRGHARQVRVTTGVESDGMIGVRGKFDPRLKVVVLGNYELADGMAVREEGK
jgi:membrane fusion protein, multidrug efflux system